MSKLPQLGLRAWTFLWTLLAMALIGNVIASAFAGNPSVINYAIFVTLWAMLTVLVGFVAAFTESLIPAVLLLGMDALAVLFTLTVGIALAAELHAKSCGNNSYTSSNHLTNGSHNPHKRCQELQASTAFFWFMFAGFAGSVFFDFLGYRSGGGSSRGGMRKGGPSMSTV
ncbi:Non-classical export protein [Lachnellula suecica]|uniref:Non-classical export protein n=1 Tax=Lachnellula suecica TaxID=602035 RepID=A0A8T9CB76_9HELO|nr:Non-classical export protein [Lachnellula suecica]